MFKKKATCIFLVVLLLAGILLTFPSFAQQTPANLQQMQKSVAEEESITAYQNLLTYVEADSRNAALETSTGLREVYGGAYIDEAGALVVNVTDDSAVIQSELIQACKSDAIKYKIVANRLIDLTAAYTELISHLGDAPYFKVVLSETKNTIEVYTNQDIATCADYVTELVDGSLVTLFREAETFTDCAILRAGDIATCDESNSWGTVGFPCYWENSDGTRYTGFVTAAHVVGAPIINTVRNSVSVNGTDFGTVNRSRYGNTVDAAFIVKDRSILPPWWILLPRLTNGESIDGWSDSSITPEGSTIRKFGATTGITQGTVISHRASITIGNYPFYSLTQTTLRAEPGDSGGPCIRSIGDENMLVGIMKGKDTNYTYYCRIDQIIKELSVTPIV